MFLANVLAQAIYVYDTSKQMYVLKESNDLIRIF